MISNVSTLAVRALLYLSYLCNNVSNLQDEDMPDLPEQHSMSEGDCTTGSIDIQFSISKSEVDFHIQQ